MIGALWRRIVGCKHRHMYRERRLYYGIEVLHLVCFYCGEAVPMIHRTSEEQRAALQKLGRRPDA